MAEPILDSSALAHSLRQAEDALRESEAQFRAVFERALDAILIFDDDSRFVDANPAACALINYSREQILGRPAEDFVEESFRPQLATLWQAFLSQGEMRGEHHIQRPDGTDIHVDFTCKAHFLPGRHLAILHDVTGSKRAAEDLRESERRFHSILDSSPSIIFIKDTQGRYVYANPQFQRLCERSANPIAGKTDLEIFPAEQAEAFRANDRQVLEAGAPMAFEEIARQEDGLHTSVVNKFPLRDTKGEIYALCGIVTDITAHKRAEATIQSLLEISARLNSTLDVDLLMEILVTGAIKLAEAAGGCAGLRTERGMVCHKYFNSRGAVPLEYCWQPGQGLPGWLLLHKVPYLTNRAGRDPQIVPELGERYGIRSALSIPILDARGEVLGFFEIHNKRNSQGFTPADQEQLMAVSQTASVAIQNALAYRRLAELKDKLAEEKLYLESELHNEYGFQNLVGESRTLKEIQKQIETVASTDATVLIQGETGTGKELIAHAIHNLSLRRERTFVRFNCAAVPAGLLESELFGHEKGAFTGALVQKIGRLELAHRGTLFLDEVGDIPLELQPKLLRAIQEKEFERLGSTKTIPVDMRLIAATNRDLAEMVAGHQFRSDLYYRLNVFPILVPPLRERTEDIPLLASHFVEKSARRMAKHIKAIPASTLEALARWHWPGNVRELENFIERAVILTQGSTLQAPLTELKPHAEPAKPQPASLEEAERQHILWALRESRGVIGGPHGAAARLGLKRTTLNSKMRKLKISRRDL